MFKPAAKLLVYLKWPGTMASPLKNIDKTIVKPKARPDGQLIYYRYIELMTYE